jgi:hypothetical protein
VPDDRIIRSLFEGTEDTPAQPLDADEIVRRSRRRRAPRQALVGGAAVLAVGAIVAVGGFGVFGSGGGGSDGSGSADSGSSVTSMSGSSGGESVEVPDSPPFAAPDAAQAPTSDGIGRAPADRINLCEGTLAEVAPSTTGLELVPHFPATASADGTVSGTVTMTNTGESTFSGSTAAFPAITLSQDGVVVWHSNGPTAMVAATVRLAPGESMDYPATFEPVRCTVADDSAESFRADLPPLEPGEYEASALIDISAGGALQLVSGPSRTISLE